MTRTPAPSAPRAAILAALAAALFAAPAAASPYDWRSYPNGDRIVAADLADDWLLLAADRPDPNTIEAIHNVLGKVDPRATLARVRPMVPGRVGLEIAGVDAEILRDVGEALVRAGLATAYWPAFARETGRGFFDDRLAIRVTSDAALKQLPALGVRVLAPSALDGVWWAAAEDGDAIGAAWALRDRPGIVWAEPDLIRDAVPLALTDDPRIAEQWHLGSPDGAGSIDAAGAWEITKGSPEIVVAIFDNGFDTDHPDLADNYVGGFDAVSNDDDPSAECEASYDGQGPAGTCPEDRPFRQSHGTAVAGVAVGRGDNQLLGAGVCPLCSLYTVRMLGEGSFRSLSNAETFQRAADDGVDVINNSWGPSITRFFPLGVAEREVFADITTRGREGKGVVLLFAAGNDFFTPATANPYATDPGVITVAASTRVDDFACYSNYGEVIAIAAPSQGCFDDEPGIATTDYAGPEGYSVGDFTNGFGGTSAASPVAAGLAGLILSANPELTAQQVRLVMQVSADRIRADKHDWRQLLGGDVDLAAEFDYDENGFSRGFGYGRINAARAVQAALAPPLAGGSCAEGCARCVDDRCVTECAADADCPGACLPAMWFALDDRGSPEPEDDAAVGFSGCLDPAAGGGAPCAEAACPADEVCALWPSADRRRFDPRCFAPGGGGLGGQACRSDADCRARWCADGRCVAPCVDDADPACAPGAVCGEARVVVWSRPPPAGDVSAPARVCGAR